jgi:hypothetical protein
LLQTRGIHHAVEAHGEGAVEVAVDRLAAVVALLGAVGLVVAAERRRGVGGRGCGVGRTRVDDALVVVVVVVAVAVAVVAVVVLVVMTRATAALTLHVVTTGVVRPGTTLPAAQNEHET